VVSAAAQHRERAPVGLFQVEHLGGVPAGVGGQDAARLQHQVDPVGYVQTGQARAQLAQVQGGVGAVVDAQPAAGVDQPQVHPVPGGRRDRPGERVADERGVRGGVQVVGDRVQVETGDPDRGQRPGQRQHVRQLRLVHAERGGCAGHRVAAGHRRPGPVDPHRHLGHRAGGGRGPVQAA
jgi:hypothetical protein